MNQPDVEAGGVRERVKAMVFDFDGTLAGLEIDFDRMRREVIALAERFGRGPDDFAGGFVLEGLDRVRLLLAETDAHRAGLFADKAREIIEGLEMTAARRSELFPCTRPALASLRRAGYRLAVITRNFGPAVNLVFPDLADYCPVFLPREAVSAVKPDPAHLLAAMTGLGAGAGETIMIGDHPIDIETGRRAGAMTAGVASGRINRFDLAAAGADLVFDNVGELSDFS